MAPHVSDDDDDWIADGSSRNNNEHSKSSARTNKRLKSQFKIIKEEYMSTSSEED
jgi:hypothetical protein